MMLIAIGIAFILFLFYYKLVIGKRDAESSSMLYLNPLRVIRYFLYHKAAIPITDLGVCKQILSSNAWPDRTDSKSFIHLYHFDAPIGLIYGCGEHYTRVKRLCAKLLKQLNFYSPRNIESCVTVEVSDLVNWIEQKMQEAGTSSIVLSPNGMFNAYALSIIWGIMFGCRFNLKESKLEKFINALTSLTSRFTVGHREVDKIPGMLFWNRFCLFWEFERTQETLYGTFRDYIKEKRQAGFDDSAEPRDLTDGFLQELKRTNGADPYVTDKSLLAVQMDFAVAGGDTISSVLEFAILHLALNPEVQEKMYSEIERVIGTSGTPLFADRARMLYTQAAIWEILRFSCVLSPGARVAKVDNVIDGNLYKEGTICYVKLFDIHRSKEIWPDPHVFRPERFLDEAHENVINTEKIIPFGFGKRQCIGQAAAEVALFGFLVTLVQKFRYEISPDLPPPSLKTSSGVTRKPLDYVVRVHRRS